MVRLSERKFKDQYGSIKNKDVVIEEVTNKPGQILLCQSNGRSILQQAFVKK